MSLGIELAATLVAVAVLAAPAFGVAPTRTELRAAKQWAAANLKQATGEKPEMPFSFVYDGKPSSELLGGWQFSQTRKKLDVKRTQTMQVYTDTKTGLEMRCVIVQYSDYPTVEWTLYFKNTGAKDTPILENIQSLDHDWTCEKGQFLLHHFTGSLAQAVDYTPLETKLEPNTTKRLGPTGGKSTDPDMSYFNLEMPGGGVIIVVGWPGQWASHWTRDGGNGLHVVAGQELTHFTLHPGEEIRAPLIVLQWWKGGDWIRSQNIWRRWMVAHNVPRPGGKLPPSQFVASSSRVFNEMVNATEENQKQFIDRYVEEGIKLDYWWMDAGWYVLKENWPEVGTWEVDPKRFPHGLRPVTDYARSKGMKAVTWFEPERVTGGTWLTENHPEWIIRGTILNIGNKDAWNWLVNHIDKMITEQGINLYRQDFNIDPLFFWRVNDTPDRQGITENHHVTGLLAYWDELAKRHPDMLLDACAGGGKRNDLECMRRAVPLWRTDFSFNTVGTQCHTYGISFWIPYSGSGTIGCENVPFYGEGKTPVEDYVFFSNAAPSLATSLDMRIKDLDYASWRRLVGLFRKYLSPNWFGDYYPLTPCSTDLKDWIGWQFDRPEDGAGMVEAFRRDESTVESMQLKLSGLDVKSDYALTDVISGKTWKAKGADLARKGLAISIAGKRGAAVIAYEKVK